MKLKAKLFKIIRYIIAFFGIPYTFLKKRESEIVILMYHRVNDNVDHAIAVKKDNFLWQMDYLNRKNYKVISMNEAYNKISSNSIDGKFIVLTFDDGYEDYYCDAFPILEKYNFPSILYLVPGYVESGKVFWWDEKLGESRLMNWEQLQNLSKSNLIEFGSHTLNHKDLNCLDDKTLKFEMESSKKILEEKLKREIIHFSYPRETYSKEAEKLTGEIYKTGVLIYKGKDVNNKLSSKDLLRLRRIPVYNNDGKFMFIAKVKGWIKLEVMLRKKLGYKMK
jgi:peptidoglycan/xylan/chitin deacetylase (PgdA/CDA1 family)